MRKTAATMPRTILVVVLMAALVACAARRPPQRIEDAIHTINRYMPEYVTEANKALEKSRHPDRERLIGIGERLAEALASLERWASEREEGK